MAAARIEDKYDSMSMVELVRNMGLAISTGFKAAATTMKFPGKRRWSEFFLTPRSQLDYQREVGDGRGNAILMSSVLWAAKNFPEAPLAIEKIKRGARKSDTPIDGHPMVKLVGNPNPYYSGELLIWATIADWMFGNAYWRKVYNRIGEVIQLWWIPSTLIEPKWEGTKSYVDYYEYKYDSNEDAERIPYDEVVHFRNGIDPKNTRKGLSPLGILMRELFTDDEAATYTATLLANLGVPGLIISPDSDNGKIAPEDVENIKQQAETRWTGTNRGRAMVLSVKARVNTLSFSPDQMKMRDIRTVPEERVTAITGIPAIVLGLGAGLQRSTFSNMAEAREAAYENFMIPSQRIIASEIRTQLLPDFEPDIEQFRVFHDLSEVRVLQQDENDIHNRAGSDFKNGLLMLDEARDMIGQSPLPNNQGQLFAVGMSVTMTPPDELYVEAAPVPAALVGSNPPNNPPGPSPMGDNLPASTGDGTQADSGGTPAAPPAPAPAQTAGRNGHNSELLPVGGGYRFLV
jgi:HK97 family phage portal protein